MFVTNSTNAFKKVPPLAGYAWKMGLNNHIGQFVHLLLNCLRHINQVSPELTARLYMYTANLAPSQGSGVKLRPRESQWLSETSFYRFGYHSHQNLRMM